jgi:hypothetical protein
MTKICVRIGLFLLGMESLGYKYVEEGPLYL